MPSRQICQVPCRFDSAVLHRWLRVVDSVPENVSLWNGLNSTRLQLRVEPTGTFLFDRLTTIGVNPFTYGRTSASQQDVFTRLQVT